MLNPDYSPVNFFPIKTVPVEKAILDILTGTAFCVERYDRKILTPSRDDLYWPSVIANNKMYKRYKDVRLSNHALFYRDHGMCVYCEKPLSLSSVTCDHVVPKTKGGSHAWENTAAACKECNAKKDDNLPVGRWKPRRQPFKPTIHQLMDAKRQFPIHVYDEVWIQYLGKNGEWPGGYKIIDRPVDMPIEEELFV